VLGRQHDADFPAQRMPVHHGRLVGLIEQRLILAEQVRQTLRGLALCCRSDGLRGPPAPALYRLPRLDAQTVPATDQNALTSGA
jgi:hypothetical protein